MLLPKDGFWVTDKSKERECFEEEKNNENFNNKSFLQYLQLNYASCNVKVDSLKLIICFQENYQTA